MDALGDAYADLTRCTAVYRDVPGSTGGRDGRSLEARMQRYLLLRDEINADIDRLADLKEEIRRMIEALPNEKYRVVLEKHYLGGLTYAQIGREIGYHKITVARLVKEALEKMEQQLR
jgi:RNA polymerase sigma factor (sigma-70 family)